MPLWGATDADESKPKHLTTAQKKEVYAAAGGWTVEAGSTMSGNGNTSATPEVLVAIGSLTTAIGLLLAHRFTSDTNCGWAMWDWTDMPDAHGRKTNTRGHTTSLRCCFHRQAACVSQEVFASACAEAFGKGAKQRIESVLIG